MSIQWKENIAIENFKLFKENSAARRAWEEDALKFEEFRYNNHFSLAEKKELLAFRQAPIPVSYTTAICDTAEAMMTASNPVIRVAPIINPYDDQKTSISKQVAAIYNHLAQKAWYDSLGSLQHDRVTRDSSNVGHGFYYVIPRQEYGEFTVDIKHMNWRYVYPHSQTKDPFYRDADNTIVAMKISKMAGYKLAKSIDPELTEEQYNENFVKGKITYTPTGGVLGERYGSYTRPTESVLFINRILLEEETIYLAIPTEQPPVEEGMPAYKMYLEVTDNLKSQVKAGKVTIREVKRHILVEYRSIGNQGYKAKYPISSYNIIPLVYDHRDNPYPYGRIWYLYPLQRALNKFMMIAILNGSLMNSLRVMAEENSIVNEYEWDKNFALPGARLTWRRVVPGHSEPPVIIQPQPLGDAWLQMPRYLSYLMEVISGIFGTMMGDGREAPSVFSTVASLQSAGGQKIKRRLGQVDAALSIVGKVVCEFYKHYAPPNSYSITLDKDGNEGEPQKYNVLRPTDNGGVEVIPETDLSVGFREVRFTSQSSNGFESGTEAALLTTLATQLKTPQLIPLILKRLNMPDVDKVMKDMDVARMQQGQIDQMQEMITNLERKSEILANQVQQKSFELSKSQFDAKFTKIIEKAKNDPNFMEAILNLGTQPNTTGTNGNQ